PGIFVFRQGDRRETFHCVRDGDTVHLFWGGRAYRFEQETERSRATHRHAGGGLEAPMPGKVIAVKVAPGDTVMKGDELLVVEAGAFVSARWVPQMAGSDEVLRRLRRPDGVRLPVLVPTRKGFDAARAATAREIAIFTAASETFNRKNINASIDESFARFSE